MGGKSNTPQIDQQKKDNVPLNEKFNKIVVQSNLGTKSLQ